MLYLLTLSTLLASAPQQPAFKTIEIQSLDQLKITADVYAPHASKKAPFIVLCHQAGWSRGEYREIAPKLNKMGFNCIAIDQRSGGTVNQVANETTKRAAAQKKGTGYADAEQDMIATLQHVRQHHADGKIILWGSSYSSALALRIAGEHPKLVDGVLAFAPGEYFARFGKPGDWVSASARKIKCPAFITSAQNEHKSWKGIYSSIPTKTKAMFLPKTKGKHGSSALWQKTPDSNSYWAAVTPFLKQFQSPGGASGKAAGSGTKAGSGTRK